MTEMRVLKCEKCGSNLILFAQGNHRHGIACLICRASNDAKEVLEHSAGLVGGTLTPEEVLDLSEQIRASGKN